MSHVTRTPLSRSKGQRSRSPGRFAHRRVGASGGLSGGRENVLAVGNCNVDIAVCSAAEGASAPMGGGEVRQHTVAAARLQLIISSAEMLNTHWLKWGHVTSNRSFWLVDYDWSTVAPNDLDNLIYN